MKNKRLLLTTIFLFCFCAFSFAKTGLGGSFSYSAATTPQAFASVTARNDVSPWSFFLNAHFKENAISFFADDWFVNERVAEYFDYFVLWGASGYCRFEKNVFEVATGCRFGAGLDFFFIKRHLEFFAQAVWNPYFGLQKSDNEYSPLFRPVNFPCTAGARLWF